MLFVCYSYDQFSYDRFRVCGKQKAQIWLTCVNRQKNSRKSLFRFRSTILLGCVRILTFFFQNFSCFKQSFLFSTNYFVECYGQHFLWISVLDALFFFWNMTSIHTCNLFLLNHCLASSFVNTFWSEMLCERSQSMKCKIGSFFFSGLCFFDI